MSDGQGSRLNFVSWGGQFPTIVFSDSDGAGRDLCGEPTLQLSGSRTGKGTPFLSAFEAQNALKSGDSPLAALDCNYFSMLWLRRAGFDFEREGFRPGLASGATGSRELQGGCMSWAVSSHCQRTEEMLPRG